MTPWIRRLWAVITGQDRRQPSASAAPLTLLTHNEAAAYLGVSPGWLTRNREAVGYVKFGPHVRFHKHLLDAYLNAERRRPGHDAESVSRKV